MNGAEIKQAGRSMWAGRAGLVSAAAAASFALALAGPGHGQTVGNYHTFTSGNPPIGDGNVYPFSLNPARASPSGGISPGTFFSDKFAFNNLNANPAFFDANNLLTRPAALITGEALWTDPKVGVFDLGGGSFPFAQIGFEIYDSFSSFGFDLAVASVSEELPTTLPFQIQTVDDFGNDVFGSGELVLDNDFGGTDRITPQASGTFLSLNSPRVGREARYRIDVFELEDLLNAQNGGGEADDNCEDDCDDFDGGDGIFINSGIFFDIDLSTIATNGGTTQIAFDNFVLNNSALPTQTPDPTYIPPTPPVGENRPQYFNYSGDAAPDNPDGDTYEIDPSVLDADFAVVSVDGEVPDELGAAGFTDSVNLYFESSDPGNGLVGHEVTHTYQSGGGGPAFDEGDVPIAPSTQVLNFTTTRGNSVPDDSISNQIVELGSVIDNVTGSLGDAFGQAFDALENNGPTVTELPGMLDSLNISNQVDDVLDDISEELSGGSAQGLTESLELMDIDPVAMNYAGFSVNAYLAYKEANGEEIVLGDQGYTLVPVFDTDGELSSYRVNTWTVTNQSGLFTPVVTNIPEPGSLALLALGGLMVSRRRRG